MTPGEVHGLQSLAKAHGGSLTINPETGLAEAGFLSSLLPMVAGFGLTALTGGAINPLTIGLITGGAGALATGSLSKGLMMGLGAYGGAGLAGMAGLGAAAGATEAAAGAGAGLEAAVPPAAGTPFTAPTISPTVAGMPPTAGTAFTAPYANPYTVPGVPAGTTAATTAGTTTAAVNPALTPTPVATTNAAPSMTGKLGADFKTLTSDFNMKNAGAFVNEHPLVTAGALGLGYSALNPPKQPKAKEEDKGYIRPYDNSSFQVNPDVQYYQPYSGASTAERNYFTGGLQALPIQKVADGGLAKLAVGGPVETMSAQNAVGQNLNYPQARLQTSLYSNPMVQRPVAENVVTQGVDTNVDPYTGEAKLAGGGVARFGLGGISSVANAEPQKMIGEYKYDYNPNNQQFSQLSAPTPAPQQGSNSPFGVIKKLLEQHNPNQSAGYQYNYSPESQQFTQTAGPGINAQAQLAGYASGGDISTLGGYSDGGRLLRGPGDGVSDSIPASIGNRQPARLADGEFVVPARIVSEIGNGSTEAGARKLYAMMDRVQGARRKTVGKNQVAKNTKAEHLLPA
jgi:hypothetical protein